MVSECLWLYNTRLGKASPAREYLPCSMVTAAYCQIISPDIHVAIALNIYHI